MFFFHISPVFRNLDELRMRIEEVWEECANDLTVIRKATKTVPSEIAGGS